MAEEKKRLQALEEAEKEKVRQERKQKKNANKKKKDDTTTKEDVSSPVKKPGIYICFEHTCTWKSYLILICHHIEVHIVADSIDPQIRIHLYILNDSQLIFFYVM